MVVGGEQFSVSERGGQPGVYDFQWVSGPNEGYGFSSAGYGSGSLTDAELEDAIGNFLSQVDRTTGFIE